MIKALEITTAILGILGLVLPAQAFEVGVRGYWWFTEVQGEIRVDSGSLEGTKIDVEDDLGQGTRGSGEAVRLHAFQTLCRNGLLYDIASHIPGEKSQCLGSQG